MVAERETRVVIADDHAPLRGFIRDALVAGGFQVCGEGSTAHEAVALALEHQPDVVMLDIRMPGSGIAAARQINRAMPGTPIVMLTQSEEDDDLFDSLKAGASGYLLKSTDPRVLPRALRAVLAGDAAMSPRLVMRVLEDFRAPSRRRLGRKSRMAAKLSAREWEIMEMLSQGLGTEDVAAKLFVSPTTIRVHVSSVLKKLAVTDRDTALKLLREE